LDNLKFTNRMSRIMRNAEGEAERTNCKLLHPIHILIACLCEKTGTLGEVSLKCILNAASLRDQVEEKTEDQSVIKLPFFNHDVTGEIKSIFETGMHIMKRYNQVYLNEGHILSALIKSGTVDDFLSKHDKEIILTLGTTPRDMITYLGNYVFPSIDSHFIRKAKHSDSVQLVNYVEDNYSSEWSRTIKEGFNSQNPPMYMAMNNEEKIVGFAVYDVYKNKKCYFGPMGVSKLLELKELDMHYSIIV